MKCLITLTFVTIASATALVGAAQAGSLENLERERAETVAMILDANLTAEDRQRKLTQSRHRLVDLERMVLRDESLKGKNTPVVRVAFRNYDLTFLAHAAVEQQVTLQDQWLDQVGVSTASLMNARVGRR